ncbi:hypothetical protein [Lichenibacterium ramalinae]|uniref:Uncharacterized protein n=1 Tax=Lichenibacterium ramalinae TaxID=2316527 RepID=A0A4Q2R7U6_9HYPH|nr:hypothetical protein [Lichenibacterium ramalinae]RYB01500.1 hypothetical protein D3272_25765 [Lichenibacterium ramalinae]
MAQIQDTSGRQHDVRRGPVPHSEAVQEAKRREKMQTVSSSHRTSGAIQQAASAGPATATQDPTPGNA